MGGCLEKEIRVGRHVERPSSYTHNYPRARNPPPPPLLPQASTLHPFSHTLCRSAFCCCCCVDLSAVSLSCQGVTYHLQIVQISTELWSSDFHMASTLGLGGYTDGSMSGHACASGCVAIAAMNWVREQQQNIGPRRSVCHERPGRTPPTHQKSNIGVPHEYS